MIVFWKTQVEEIVQQEIRLYLYGTSVKLVGESFEVSCAQFMIWLCTLLMIEFD